MIRKKLSKICSSILAIAMVVGVLSTGIATNNVYAADTSSSTTSSGIELSKTATLEDDGTYTINLEAYATGETTTTTITSGVPLDIVLVIDQSGSMTNSITSVSGYTARTSQAYTYQGYGDNTYYYLAEDGNYYAVSRGSQRQNQGGGGGGGNNNNYYYLYYTDANGNTVYLSGTGTTTTQPTNVTNNNTTIWTGVLYSATTTSTTRLAALKTAVTSFVNAISDNASETGADHRIAIAGFACGDNDDMSGYQNGSWNWKNTGLFINGSLTNYATEGSSATTSSLTAKNYQDALVSVNDENGNVASSITTAISNFQAEGATYISYGMEMANNVFANNSATYTKDDGTEGTRQRIVVVFTDGAPGYSGYTASEAGAAVNYSYTVKNTYSATVYTVGLYASSDETDNVKAFMNYLSSNYPSAQYSNNSWSAGTQASSKYYMTTNDATELNNIFTTISTDVTGSSTTVTLDENSVMKDIMGEGFTLTNASVVTVATYSGNVDSSGKITFDTTNATSTSDNCIVTKDVESNTVSVKGFDYADKYISSGHGGEKICVTITGVLPTTSVTTNESVYTNAATSGIYVTADATEATATFEQPQTIITKKLYVLDYAKEAELTDLDQSSVTGIVDGFKSVSDSDRALTQSYGNSELSNGKLTYTPTTTSWGGYDSFYVFGQTTNSTVTTLEANSNGNLWSKVSVIPANNVYYEDDFITTSTDGTTSTGTVGIVYSDDNEWTKVGTSDGNTEIANGSTYGWENSLCDDNGDSDGSSHSSSTYGATATFKFTGTGVDIYSRTNMNSGKIYVRLVSDDSSVKAQSLLVDELAVYYGEDGTYYQIPTASFSDLDYGTYTVTITVMLGDDEDGEYTYYLDGIRVYNPLGTVTDDGSDAGDAYKRDNELNAVFTEVRDILIDAKSFTADMDDVTGVLFIDNNVNAGTTETETEHSTSDSNTQDELLGLIGTYVDYGPKNEVYLATNQSIAFKVNDAYLVDGVDAHFYIGLKSTDGLGTTAIVTNGTGTYSLTINHTTDLYYEITPTSDGYIMIKNTGSKLLSVTKLRVTSAVAVDTSDVVENEGDTNTIALLSTEEVYEVLEYASTFDSLTTVDYVTDDYSDSEITEDDIVIENSETDDTDDSEDVEDTTTNESQSIFSSIINSIRNWFSSWR
ncbi:MAG: hypothetical protein LUH02_05160 [Erysipelotrichaceae bacterium]|nr:hypothetical protein [Erysipelotrichaceae bacterium]